MNIDLRKFVDVNIQPQNTSAAKTSRETIVLLSNASVTAQTFSSYSEAVTALTTSAPACLKAIKTYFDCGGKKIHLVSNVSYTVEAILAATSNLSDKEIVVTYADETNSGIALSAILAQVATTYNLTNYGIKTKLFLAPTDEFSNSVVHSGVTINFNDIANLILKYDDSEDFANRADLSIAAYLSKIDVVGINTVNDYCYTVEPDYLAATDADTEMIDDSRDTNINVDISLAGATRNIGGNCTNGEDIVNAYVRIILQQTVTDVLIQLLSTHLKGSAGLTRIYSTIVKDLEKYLTCGYLVTDKVWTKEDVTVNYGGQNYTIVKRGTPLISGYNLTILPYSSLTEDDKARRRTPPIYLLLAEQYGIRTITINGEVI